MALVWPDAPIAEAVLDPEMYSIIESCVVNKYVLPCLGVTGFASGLLIHMVLKPVMVGVPGLPWQKLAGAVLAASFFGLGALYSTGMRTDVPHLREVEINEGGLINYGFEVSERCYVKGRGELCWVPGVDPLNGEPLSVRRNGSFGSEKILKGKEKFLDAKALRGKCNRAEFKTLFTSRSSAYFGGLLGKITGGHKFQIQSDEMRELLDELPIGENLVTDATVAFALGKVDKEKVEEGLRECWELLESSRLAERRRKRWKMLVGGREGWADGHINALFEELWLRGAELRELERLVGEAEEKVVGKEELKSELEGAGIEVGRALAALKKLRGKGGGGNSETQREIDWELIRNGRQKEGQERARENARLVSVLGVLGGIVLGAVGLMYK